MSKVYTQTEIKLRQLEDNLAMLQHKATKLQAMDMLMARVRASVSVSETVTNAPVYWTKPTKGYRPAPYGQWKRWLESRVGLLPIDSAIAGAQVLCISCGIPIALSTGDKTLRGTRGNKVMENGGLNKVVVGALVKLKGEDITVYNAYSETQPTVMDIEEYDKYVVVTHKALGCIHCQQQYRNVCARVNAENEQKQHAYRVKYQAYMARVSQYLTQCPEVSATERKALLRFHGDAPKDRTPYIEVDVKVIHREQTVAYWREQCSK